MKQPPAFQTPEMTERRRRSDELANPESPAAKQAAARQAERRVARLAAQEAAEALEKIAAPFRVELAALCNRHRVRLSCGCCGGGEIDVTHLPGSTVFGRD